MANESDANRRQRHFADNWLAWAALRHFLPASLVRELACVIVERMSGGDLNLKQLFDETITGGPGWIDSWLLKPRDEHTPLGKYLQRIIRAVAWQNDAEPRLFPEVSSPPGVIKPSVLEKAIVLGRADLSWPEKVLKDLCVSDQYSISVLAQSILTARETFKTSSVEECLRAILPPLAPIQAPLAVIIVKHLGDLCADADAWDKALNLYEEAGSRMSSEVDSPWNDLTSCLRVVITQSQASAIRTLKGADAAAKVLCDALAGSSVIDNPLLLANASHDALVATYASVDKLATLDRRAALLSSPLLQATHSPSSALQAWIAGDFTDSHRRFWAVLRRQTALGLATESRITKALYARSILDGLASDIARSRRPESFQMAIGLLLESGNTRFVGKIPWNEQLVDAYVDDNSVEFAIAHAKGFPGSCAERQLVLVELFQHWAELISIDRVGVANRLLKHIAALARESSTSLLASEDLGGRSLEMLHSVAKKRPELRNGVALEVAEAVTRKLSVRTFWKALDTALSIAQEYGDVFSTEQLQSIIRAALDMLAKIDPAAQAWPVVRPALTFLVSDSVKNHLRSAPELGERIVDTVVRFGVQQETEYARVLFYLHDFDPALLSDTSLADKLRASVMQVRHRSLQTNASNAVENIEALLLAPAIAGGDGVHDALDGLARILQSAGESRVSIGLPFAYGPVLLLANEQHKIADGISLSLESFRSWLSRILELVINLWLQAKERPLLFAPFSLPPPTQPNSTIVHNWAYSSIVFAESLQQGERLLAALAGATSEAVLANPIAVARTIRSLAGRETHIDAAEMRKENRDTFYAALGWRLVVLQRVDVERRREICEALLDQCFRHGPRDLDAAVFLSALRLDLGAYVAQSDHSDYMKRVENYRDFRLALLPILQMLGVDR